MRSMNRRNEVDNQSTDLDDLHADTERVSCEGERKWSGVWNVNRNGCKSNNNSS